MRAAQAAKLKERLQRLSAATNILQTMANLCLELDKALPGWMNYAYEHFNRIDEAKSAMWWSIQTTKSLVYEEYNRLYHIWTEDQKRLDGPPKRRAKERIPCQSSDDPEPTGSR